MIVEISFTQLKNALKQERLKYCVADLPNDYQILISEHWGKIFGPFRGEKDTGSLWISKKVCDRTLFHEMVRGGDWCIGGDRVWLAPEVQYNIADRFSSIDNNGYSLPSQIDPGNYTLLSMKENKVELEQEMDLTLHNTATGRKRLHLKRFIKPAMDPLRHIDVYGELSKRVLFTGYTQEVALTDLSPDTVLTEVWNLLQLNPGGVVLIPTAGKADYQDYYKPIEQQLLQVMEGACFLKITGKNKYKVGFKSACVFGRIGYFEERGDGNARIIIRSFYNNPAFAFIDEPLDKPGTQGDSVQFYNDDGGLGGFGEIEVHGSAVGGTEGSVSSRDIFEFWQYTGERSYILKLAYLLLGIGKPEL